MLADELLSDTDIWCLSWDRKNYWCHVGTQMGPTLLLTCNRRSCRHGQPALLQQNGNSGMLGIFIFLFLFCHWWPGWIGDWDSPCAHPCAVGAALPWGLRLVPGWMQGNCAMIGAQRGKKLFVGVGGGCVWNWCTCVSSSCQQGPPLACASSAACVWGFGGVGLFLGRGREVFGFWIWDFF